VSLILALVIAAHPPLALDVFVPLCDSNLIACGRGAAGDPESLRGNLYWGAAYGAERYLSRARGFRVSRSTDRPIPDRPYLLREVRLVREARNTEREVHIRLLAYSGRHIDQALADFLAAAGGLGTEADLVVWAGHDRLMDVPPPPVSPSNSPKPVVVLACSSQQYFGPVLQTIGARPLAWTRTFMAPEAYLLEALASAVAQHGLNSSTAIRQELIKAYARFQRIPTKAASTVFAPVPTANWVPTKQQAQSQ
jgi:hypothetical protein